MGLGKTVCHISHANSLLTSLAPMYSINVDIIEAISRGWETDYSEVRHCMSVNVGEKLGERAG